MALVDGKNQVTKWNYDKYGRVTNKLDQAGTEILRYQYDANSRLTNRWSAAKGTTSYSYDAVGNLIFVNYPASPDVSFQYDPLNRVTNMIDAVGTNKYAYAVGGQLWAEDGPFADDTVTNSYNNRLRVSLALQQPTGVWPDTFGYDAAKRLTNVTSPAGAFSYQLSATQPSTLIHQLALPNTSYITNVYDMNARLLSTTLKSSSHSTLNSHIYAYNTGNQRTQQTFPDSSTTDYTYDKIGQLKIADSSVNSDDRGYLYDPAWNLIRRTNAQDALYVDTFNVDGKNQVTNTSMGGDNRDCTYDSNGNLLSLPLNYGSQWHSYWYDDENRLVIWTYSESGQPLNWWDQPQSMNDRITYFTYDGLGRLRQQVEYPADEYGSSWSAAVETRYIYDDWRVIQERDGSNVPLVSYTRGSDLSGSLEGAGGIGGLLARSHDYSGGNWSTHSFYHADGNGNITYLVDGSQGLAASYCYDPYGNLISSSGSLANDNTYRFSSKMIHVNSGLYYYGYRWYAPILQRWVTQDPLGEPGFEARRQRTFNPFGDGPNLYRFVHGNPMSFNDPFGLRLTEQDCENFKADCFKDISDLLGRGARAGVGKGACTAGVAMAAGKRYGSHIGKTVGGVGGVWTLWGLGRNMGEALERQKQCKKMYQNCLDKLGLF